jgi:hypothetical protein
MTVSNQTEKLQREARFIISEAQECLSGNDYAEAKRRLGLAIDAMDELQALNSPEKQNKEKL